MKFILGTKGRMSQIFTAEGRVVPVTVITAGPITVTQVKGAEADGYEAVQVGFGTRKEKNLSQAVRGHLKDLGAFRILREFRVKSTHQRGDVLDVSQFTPGDTIEVSGTSKGKGNQGVVKRHGFAGSPASHGHKGNERRPGSIGSRWPQRVFKGMRMAGRMGGERITVRGLKVVQVDTATNTLVIRGAIPGVPGSILEIRSR
jgi:large subunit ribosomal protein L3